MGESSKTTQTAQQQQTGPYAAAQPWLDSLIKQYGGLNTGVTGDQSGALANLNSAASGIPNFGGTAAGGVSKLFDSSTAPQVGMLNTAYGNLQKSLGGAADPGNINPLTDPGIGDTLGALNKSITNQVKGVYAGSGRAPSGAGSFAGSLATGLAQGEAPVIANQFNADRANQQQAAGALFNAGGTTASGITGQNQIPLSNILSGIQGAGALSGLYTSPGIARLGAANASYAQPYTNLGASLTPAATIGALGSQSTGTGTSTTTGSQSLLSNILAGMTGTAGLLGVTGAFGRSSVGSDGSDLGAGTGGQSYPAYGTNSGWLSQLMASDKNVKTDVAPVGKLFDGQTVHSFKYKGSNTPQIGLLAQDVEKDNPEANAVVPIAGIKHVHLGRATARARAMGGMLRPPHARAA